MAVVTLALAGCALLALWVLVGWRQSYWRKRGVACPPGWPLLGHVLNLLLLRRSPGQFFRDLYNQAPGEPLVGFYIFGKPAVLVRSPELLRSVLVKDFAAFADRYNISDERSDPLGTRNLFVIKGPEWKYLRAKLSPRRRAALARLARAPFFAAFVLLFLAAFPLLMRSSDSVSSSSSFSEPSYS